MPPGGGRKETSGESVIPLSVRRSPSVFAVRHALTEITTSMPIASTWITASLAATDALIWAESGKIGVDHQFFRGICSTRD